MHTINVDGHHLTLPDVIAVAKAQSGNIALQLTPASVVAVERASRAVEQRVVYGITTGFGAFKDQVIPEHQLGPHARLGRGSAAAYALIRDHIPFLPEDAEMAPHMARAAELVASGAVCRAVQTALAHD